MLMSIRVCTLILDSGIQGEPGSQFTMNTMLNLPYACRWGHECQGSKETLAAITYLEWCHAALRKGLLKKKKRKGKETPK